MQYLGPSGRKKMTARELYELKGPTYYTGVRSDWVNFLPVNKEARLLEIGCGTGDTGQYAITQDRCGFAVGIELNERAAETARTKLSEVICGNIETIPLPFKGQTFDLLFMSEVLEHLVDPWGVLRKLRPFMKPGALIFASSPNVSNFKVLRMQIIGDWALKTHGVMDKTHLRWFTPRSYRRMFEECGYQVTHVGAVEKFSFKKTVLSKLTLGKLDHLLIVQINIVARS